MTPRDAKMRQRISLLNNGMLPTTRRSSHDKFSVICRIDDRDITPPGGGGGGVTSIQRMPNLAKPLPDSMSINFDLREYLARCSVHKQMAFSFTFKTQCAVSVTLTYQGQIVLANWL